MKTQNFCILERLTEHNSLKLTNAELLRKFADLLHSAGKEQQADKIFVVGLKIVGRGFYALGFIEHTIRIPLDSTACPKLNFEI
jgi:hypothetical protein